MKNSLILLIIILLVSGCGQNEVIMVSSEELVKSVAAVTIEEPTESLIIESTIEVWLPSEYIVFDDTDFLRNNSDMTINYTVVSKETINNYLAGLLSEDIPDVLIVNEVDYGVFSKLNIFEDFNKAPYYLEQMALENDVFSHLGWSYNKDQKIGLMTHFSPIVTYYRADLFEEIGYSSDPAQVAQYFSDKEELMAISLKFKEKDQYLFQWKDDFNSLIMANTGYFDHNLEPVRNNQQYKDIYDFSLFAYQNDVVSNINFWTDQGIEALNNDHFVSFYFGYWGINEFAKKAPEQVGEWRMTSLPFGMKASEGYFTLIPSKADNKEKAWEWIIFNYSKELNNWIFAKESTSSCLNYQVVSDYLQEGLDGTYDRVFSPFDSSFNLIYRQRFNNYIEAELTYEAFYNAYENIIEEGYAVDIARYKQQQ